MTTIKAALRNSSGLRNLEIIGADWIAAWEVINAPGRAGYLKTVSGKTWAPVGGRPSLWCLIQVNGPSVELGPFRLICHCNVQALTMPHCQAWFSIQHRIRLCANGHGKNPVLFG